MILKLHIALMAAGMLLTGNYSYGQAPDLGAASDFAVFTAAGAFNVAGASTFVTGDVGTNVGAFNGFPPGVLVGQIHVADAVSAAAATDVALAYGSLSTVTCGQVISVTMGNGQTLLPDVYCTGAASTINGDLILDAQGDPDAIFIFKIGGALATTVDSRIILVNGASLCNVYWQVNGQVDLGENSIFQGTLLVNGAINLLDGAELIGQALSQAGAISLQNNVVTIGEPAVASTITATSATSFCEGESVILTGNVGGVWNTGAETSEIEVSTSGDFFVTNTTNCGSEVSNTISVTVNPPPACEISGDSTTCAGEPTQLCAPDGLASYLWSTGETSQCISVNTTGTFSVTITDGNGCSSSCSHDVTFVCDPVITPVDPIVLPACNAELPVLTAEWTDCGTSGTLTGEAALQSVDGCVETYLYTFSGIDACGESFGTTTTVTRTVDVSAPIITELPDFQLDGCNQPWPTTLTTNWSDNCSAGGEIEGVAGVITTVGCLESRVYTFDVTDDCGNSASTTTVVTRVVDEAAPVIVPVADFQIAGCDQPWPEVISTTWSDNCSEGGIVIGEAGLVTIDGCGEERIYTFSVTDECGNTAQSFVTVTRIFDETAPTILNPADYVLPGCNPDWPLEVLADWTDNCSEGGTLIGVPGEIITDGCSQSRSYTFSVMDECGNEATTVTIVTRIFDEANPVIEPVADFQLEGCNAEWPVLVSLWTSNCAGGGNVTGVPGEVSIDGCIESREYTFTVNDDCGVSASTTTTVTRVVDEAAPVIEPVADFQIAGCDQPWPEVIYTTWSDNCSDGGELIAEAGLVTVDGCGEDRVYTFSVTDECGNTAESSVTVTRIFDEIAPSILNPADYVLPGCNPDWPSEVLADWTDNCSGGGTLVGVPGEIITDGCSQSRSYTFSVMDECGNEAIAVTIVTRIFDEANPVIEPIADFQLEGCNAEWPVLVSLWTSNCAGGGNVTGVPGEVSIDGCLESRVYTFTVNDDCGVSASTTTTVTRVVDEAAPIIEPVADFQIAGCDQPWPEVVSTTWSDNCSEGGIVIGEAGLVTTDGCGEERIYTFSVTDECGNTAGSSVTVTRIFDETAPTIVNPADYVLPGCNPDWPLEVLADWTDNCSAGGTLVGVPGEIITDGCSQSRSYTFSVMDECGNETIAVTIVTRIFDEANPVIEPIADFQLEGCNAEWPVLVSLWTSNCAGGGNVTGVPGEVSIIGCLESRVYTFTVNDDCGVSASTTTVVTRVVDEAAPVIEPVADFQIAGCDQPWPAVVYTTWSDNCSEGGELIADAGLVTADGCGEQRLYTFSVTDECGNTAESFVTVTRIFDETAPTILNPADYVLPGCNPDWPLEVLADWTDNCSAGGTLVGVPGEIITDGCSQSRSYTFSVMDECGNEATTVTIVTRIFDEANPVIEPIADFQLEGCNAEWPVLVSLWTSNCAGGGNVTGVPGEVSIIGCLESRVYTFTVNDDCGVSASTTTVVTRVVDEAAPIIEPVADFQIAGCDQPWPEVISTTWSDNCSEGGIVIGDAGLVTIDGCGEERIYTFSVTDECGNTAESFVTVTRIFDETAPIILNPADYVLPGCNPDWPSEVLADWTDNCSAGGTLLGVPGEIITDGCSQSRSYTFSVMDECGNETIAVTIVTRQFEETAPEIDAIADFQLELCNAPWPPLLTTTWSDDCGSGGIVEAFPGEITTENCLQTRPYTFNVTSECGNSAQAVVWVSRIFDETGPVFGPIEPFTVQCDEFDAIPTPSVTDNCTLVELTFTDEPVSEICNYSFVRTWIATDDCFNTTTAEQIINVVDTVGPVFDNIESVITVACIEDVPVSTPTVYDECTGEILDYQVSIVDGGGNPEEICVLTTAIGPGSDWALWLPTHYNNGFSSTANFVFDADGGTFDQYEDGTAHLYGTVINDINPAESYVLDFWFENKRDWTEWSALGRSYKDDLSLAEAGGELWTTWSYYELVNNTSTASGSGDLAGNMLYFQHMPVSYLFGFQIGLAANNKNSNYGMSGWFSYTGVIDGANVNGYGDVNVDADCVIQQLDECINQTTYTIQYIAIDDCFNSTVFTQLVIVNDTIAPEFVDFPEDITVSCDEWPIEVPEVVAVDNCEGEVILEYFTETSEGICDGDFIVTHTWIATDICGNTSSATWNVTVADTSPPVVTACPADAEYDCFADVPAADISLVTAIDDCNDVVITWEGDVSEGDECTGTVLRTYRATDACGNYTVCVQVITYSDDEAPIFVNAPGNITADCADVPDPLELIAIDNCSEVTIVFNEILFSGGCTGVLHRIWTATDDCGNEAVHEQFINLTDTVAPTLHNLPADGTYECNEDVPAPAEVWVTDNCDDAVDVIFEQSTEAGACANEYTIFRTWSATDTCENSVSYTQVINIVDTTAPVFDAEDSEITVACDEDIEIITPMATDNCDQDVTVSVETTTLDGQCPNAWTEIYIWTATDNCGNNSSVSLTVNYVDDVAPELIMPQDTSFTADCGYFQGDDAQAYLNGEMTPADSAAFVAYVQSLFASQGLIPLGVIDNCDPDAYWEETSIDILVDVDCPLIYQINCNFQAFDNCGNVSGVETTYLFITDDQPPVIECPAPLSLVCPSEIPAPNTELVIASDDCSDVVVTWEGDETDGDECTGTILRTYRATDACGNYAECVQVITYNDDEAPVFIDLPEDATFHCNDEIPEPEEPEAVDNCSSEITYTAEAFIEGYSGEEGLEQCELTTPLEVVGAEWALWLPNSIGEPQYYHLSPAGGQFVELPNGGAHLTGMVYAPNNPNKRWIIDVYFKDRADWEEWGIDLGRGYKDDANIAGDNYLDWDYYILNSDSATLTGDGLYTGSELTLAHAPASYYFGFQVGLAANNRNAADGMSGWFFYNGSWIGNEGLNGIGDFGFEKECLECDYTITRIWTATDYCGNTNTAVQVITVEPGEDDNENLDAANPDKVPAVVLGAWPNPTTYRSTITFEIPEPSRVTLEVFNMDGKLIETLYQGEANSGQEYFYEFNADQLSNGMYIYKLTTDKAAYIDKLMIAR